MNVGIVIGAVSGVPVDKAPRNLTDPGPKRSHETPQGEVLVDDDAPLVVDGAVVVLVVVVVVEFVTVRVGAVTEMPIDVDPVSVFWAVVVLLELSPCASA